MRFSKFKGVFLIISLVIGIGMFFVTFAVFDGFRASITFNGGVRLSIVLPEEMDGSNLEQAAVDAGLENPSVRSSNPRINQFDLEFGPNVRDRIDEEIKAWERENPGIAGERREERSIPGEIEKLILPALGLGDDVVTSREAISASYGQDLMNTAFWAFFLTVLFIGLYLAFRFDFSFAAGASVALLHDILLTVGFIGVARIEPSIPVVAAVLTVIGYSINDTIVIFDRIRQNIDDRTQAADDFVMDTAISQTLSRTLITSFLTLVAVVALIVGGADTLKDFAYVLVFGILIGTYSSIFVASHFVQFYEQFRARVRARS